MISTAKTQNITHKKDKYASRAMRVKNNYSTPSRLGSSGYDFDCINVAVDGGGLVVPIELMHIIYI